MLNSVRLYGRYLAIAIRSQMQYRASFLMMVLGNFFMSAIEFVGIWALFARFGSLRAWTLPEVALFYGIINVAFGISEGFARGFDVFAGMIKRGDFDRLLVRPRSTFLQILGLDLRLTRVGRVFQGLVVLLWGAAALEVVWSPSRILLMTGAIAGGTCLFCGLRVLEATLAFWTVESLEIMNVLTYGGVETAQYPLTIYRPWFRRFFTFVIPLACINYFPAHAILGSVDILGSPTVVHWVSPVVGVLFLLVTIEVWRFGVRHYTSTGS